MKAVLPENYLVDTLFPRVARAVDDLLASGMAVSVPRVLVKIGMLSPEKLREWQQGRVPYLERMVMGSLGKTNRIVRIVSFYAHDLKLPIAPQMQPVPSGTAGGFCAFRRPAWLSSRPRTSGYLTHDRPTGRRSRHQHRPRRVKSAVEQRDAADEGRLEAYGSIVVGEIIVSRGKVVRPSQLIASVRQTLSGARRAGTDLGDRRDA